MKKPLSSKGGASSPMEMLLSKLSSLFSPVVQSEQPISTVVFMAKVLEQEIQAK